MTSDNQSTPNYLDRYGKGLCYSLGLFLAHEANFKYVLAEVEIMVAESAIRFDGAAAQNREYQRMTIDRLAATRWFSHAANPIRNLVIPADLPKELQDRLDVLLKRCLKWSFPGSDVGQPVSANVRWALDEAKELLRLIDEFRGVQTAKEGPKAAVQRDPFLVFRR